MYCRFTLKVSLNESFSSNPQDREVDIFLSCIKLSCITEMPEFNCLKPFGLNLTEILCHKENSVGLVVLLCGGFFALYD